MLDIVEIALNNITDFNDFEKLACEVLQQEGYPDIKPLGGMSDRGQDALVERFWSYEGQKLRIVFQITVQETVEAKLRQTIKRLDEGGVEYNQLIIVTPNPLSTERQMTLRKTALGLDVNLDVIERKTLVNRLANPNNGIFQRHFPDIRKQVEVLLSKSTDAELQTENVVRSALAFTSGSPSERARTRVLGELVLALLLQSQREGATAKEISALHRKLLPQAVPLTGEQITAVMKGWAIAGIVQKDGNGKYRLTESGMSRSLASSIDWDVKGRTLASDVTDMMEQATGTPLDSTMGRLAQRNARESLGLLFRLMGLEISSQLLGMVESRRGQIGSHEAIIAAAMRDLPDPLGKVLIASLAELVANPNSEQADALKAYACGYIGASLVEVDPAVRELQVTRLREKVFLLDTDFLIDCLVTDNPVHSASLNLVQSMVAAGIRVLVPDDCVIEAAQHAGLAHRTVNHFGNRIHGLSIAEAPERIQNAFALGWYFRNLREPISFERYIANYHEPTAPVRYMFGVVTAALPAKAEVGDVTQLLDVAVDEGQVDALSQELYQMMLTSRKSQYRSEEETMNLARTDARLYAAALAFEEKVSRDKKGRALRGSCYLITSSLRFIRAVETVFGRADEISARPNTLAALFQLAGKTRMSAREFVALFDNPLLQYAVTLCQEDVELLLDAGLSARDKSLPRLIWDLDAGLHAKIAAVAQKEEVADETLGEQDEEEVTRSYLDLIADAQNRGYAALPAAAPILHELTRLTAEKEDLSKQVDDLAGRLKEMESAIELFGRRRQRYLRKIARGEPYHKAH